MRFDHALYAEAYDNPTDTPDRGQEEPAAARRGHDFLLLSAPQQARRAIVARHELC
jgi:hypothetical protein